MTSSTLEEMRCRQAAAAPKYVSMKADSGLTYAHLPVVSRKRSRQDSNSSSINMNMTQSLPYAPTPDKHEQPAPFTFLGQDISSRIHLHQLQLDQFISHHMEMVRFEMEERSRKSSRRMMAAVEESIVKQVKAKEEEIEKIAKLNSGLVDRVKSLYVENQIWRDIAETKEATATALRANLEQVLTQAEPAGDAHSSCASNYHENAEESSHFDNTKLCKSCGKEEACVLLLPCRHLCLCSACGSYLHICPVCKSSKSCSLHVNFST